VIFARIPAKSATSKSAKYRIKTADGWVTRKRNQRRHQGEWVRLGVFELTKQPVVKLSDKTGEKRSKGRRLAFDAVRFKPSSAPAVAVQSDESKIAEPTAKPAPVPTPSPTVEPTSEPTTEAPNEPEPMPPPEPAPEPEPTPAPEPEPMPLPEPTPAPEPEPALAPEPNEG
jgi:hypothetical protein